jgi:hypothetical protein
MKICEKCGVYFGKNFRCTKKTQSELIKLRIRSLPVENTDIYATTIKTATKIIAIMYERTVDSRRCPSLFYVAE